MSQKVRVASLAEIAKMIRLALDIQAFATSKGYTQDELLNCILSMAGEFIGQMKPEMQVLALNEILYVAGLKKSSLKRFN